MRPCPCRGIRVSPNRTRMNTLSMVEAWHPATPSTGKDHHMTGTPEFLDTDIRRFQPRAQELIALAQILGWVVRWQNSKKKAATLLNGDTTSRKTVTIPITNINANRVTAAYRQIMQHTDLAKVKDLAIGKVDLTQQPETVQRVIATLGTRLYGYAAESVAKRTGEDVRTINQSVGEAMAEARAKPAPPKKAVPAGERVVKTEPVMVSRGWAGEYESKTAVKQTLADGTERFKCMHCEYTGEKFRAVASHAITKHPNASTPDYRKDQEKRRAEGTLVSRRPGGRGNTKKPVTKAEPVSIQQLAGTTSPTLPEVHEVSPGAFITEVTPAHTSRNSAQAQASAPLRGITLLTHEIRQGLKLGGPIPARDAAVHLRDNLSAADRMEIATVILVGQQYDVLRTSAESAIDEANQRAEDWKAKYDKVSNDLKTLRDLLKGVGE